MNEIENKENAVELILSRIASKPEEETHGIVESEELVRFFGRLYEAVYRAAEDKSLTVTDARFLFNVLPTVNPAFKGITAVPAEFGDLDSAETERLGNVFAQEVKDLPNTRSKELSIKALVLGLQIVEFVGEVREVIANSKTVTNGEG